jgi:YfiH family protein
VFTFRDTRGSVDVAFTDRDGGVSRPPYDSLNLAAVTEDDPDAVTENLRRTMAAFAGDPDTPLARLHQVHGSRVVVVDDPAQVGPASAGIDGLPEADGLVTRLAGVTLMVRVADCVPVLLADRAGTAVGALHVGRPGLVAGTVPAGVAALDRLGAADLVAWLGPHVCGRCYEVPETMRRDVTDVVPEAWSVTSWDTPAVDVGAGVRAQLADAGVLVVDASRCTLEDDGLYSHRRDGSSSGRLAGLVRIRPEPAREAPA